jgi:hypothetical protein
LSELDSSVFGAGVFTAGVCKVFAAGGVEAREVVSSGRFGSAGDVASTARFDLWASRERFPSGPRPTASPTIKLVTANKITNAATCNPGIARTYKCEREFLTRSRDDSTLSVRTCRRKPATRVWWCTFSRRSSTSARGLASRMSGATISVAGDAVCTISLADECSSCSGKTLPTGSSGKLSNVAGRKLSAGTGVKPSNSGAGFSDAIQSEI